MSRSEEETRSALDRALAERGIQVGEQQGSPLDRALATQGLSAQDVQTTPLESPADPRRGVRGAVRSMGPGREVPRPMQTQPSEMRERFKRPAPQVVVTAAENGILFDKPAPSGHFLASLAIDDKHRAKAYEQSLSDRFGEQARVRIGPQTGEPEYFDPETRRFALIDPPGMNVANIEGIGGAAITLAPEVLTGGAAALLTRNPIAVEMGAGAGAFVGEIVRLTLGRQMGVNEDVTDAQILKKAAVVGGVSALAGGAANKALKFGRFLIDMVDGRVVPKQAAEILETDAQQAQQVVDAVNERVGSAKFRLSLAQASGDEDLLTMQDFYRRSPEFASQFREFTEQQQGALREYYDTINRPYRSYRTTQQSGEAAQQVAESRVARETMRQDEFVRMKEADLEFYLRGLDTRPYESLGRPIRDIGDSEQVAFRQWSDRAARALDDLAGNQPFIANANTVQVVSRMDREAREALIPLVERQNRALIGRNLTETQEVAGEQVEIPLRKIIDPEAEFTFREAWQTVSALKRIERIASKGLSTDEPSVGSVRELYTALEKDMKSAMSGSALRTEYERFVRRYASEKTRLDRGSVASILEREGGRMGRHRIADEKVFEAFFTPGTRRGAEEVHALIQNDPGTLQEVRRGIIDFWRRSVVSEGRVNTAAHKQWMERYREPAGVFMNKDELRMLENPATAERALRAREAARKRALDRLNKTFEAQLTDLNNPGRIVPLVMDRNNPGAALQLSDMLKETPEVLRAVRSSVRREIGERIAGQYKNGERFFSAPNLDTFLNGRGGEKGFRENLRNVFGEQYVKDLDTLNEAMKLTTREPQFPNRSNTAFWIDTVKNLSRAYVGLFTRPGRVITAVDRLRGRAANRVLLRAILNPNDLRQLVELRGVDLRKQQAAGFVGALGGTALLEDFGPGFEDAGE